MLGRAVVVFERQHLVAGRNANLHIPLIVVRFVWLT